jgi:hypothetical protein
MLLQAVGKFGHTPLETLRQDALNGNWGAAQETCCNLDLQDSADRAALELVLAVWAEEPDPVAAAIAKMERVNCRCLGAPQTADGNRSDDPARGRTSIRPKSCCCENPPPAKAIR